MHKHAYIRRLWAPATSTPTSTHRYREWSPPRRFWADRLKEWAYAGLTFIYIGAIASHIWARDDVRSLIGPLILAGLAVASWALRPASRGFESNTVAMSRKSAVAKRAS